MGRWEEVAPCRWVRGRPGSLGDLHGLEEGGCATSDHARQKISVNKLSFESVVRTDSNQLEVQAQAVLMDIAVTACR